MRTLAIAQKVIKELLRDKRTLLMMFIAPILIMWLMNVMFSASTSTSVTLATVHVPDAIITSMDNVSGVHTQSYDSIEHANTALKDQNVDAVISYSSSNGYSVSYSNIDPTKTAFTRHVLKGAIQASQYQQLIAIIKGMLTQPPLHNHATAPHLEATKSADQNKIATENILNKNTQDISESYNYGNANTTFFAKMIPVLVGFVTFFFVFLISGMALLKERTSGTLERLLATPVRRSEIVFGYMISYGIIALIQTTIIVFATIWLLDVEVVGNIINVIIVNGVLGLVALSFGILLSTLAKSEFQMMQFIPLVVIPQLFFSGIIPLSAMAPWVQVVGTCLPLTYSGDAMTKIIMEGKGLYSVWYDIGILVIFLIILTFANIIGMRRYRKV